MQDILKDRVRQGYSRTWVVDKYAIVGLWPSEDRLITTYWPTGGRILDLGCGAGRTTLPLIKHDYWVTGADLALPMVRRARAQARQMGLSAPWAVLDGTALPFGDNCFDGALFSYNGIELVPGGIAGKRRVIEEVWRVLKPGGHFIFTTHALEALNRYAPIRLRRLLAFWASRILRRPIPETEMGEVIHDLNRNLEYYYMQIVSPRIYRSLLAQTGFELVYYNSRSRIDAQKPPRRFIADIDPDFKFYVAKKGSREK